MFRRDAGLHQRFENDFIRNTFYSEQSFFGNFPFSLFLSRYFGNIDVGDLPGRDKAFNVISDFKAGAVRISKNNNTVLFCKCLNQSAHFSVFENTKSIGG